MITSIRKHIYKIKKLIREYYYLEDGFLIDRPYELLKLTNNPKVYISRKSLKHFVERRKGESVTLSKLNIVIDCIEVTIQKYDSILIEESKIIYIKNLEDYFKSSLRVVTELVGGGTVQIKSIHFQKTKKLPSR